MIHAIAPPERVLPSFLSCVLSQIAPGHASRNAGFFSYPGSLLGKYPVRVTLRCGV